MLVETIQATQYYIHISSLIASIVSDLLKGRFHFSFWLVPHRPIWCASLVFQGSGLALCLFSVWCCSTEAYLGEDKMGGVTNTLGYITAAFAMGMLLKGTDWISWRIDERSVRPHEN